MYLLKCIDLYVNVLYSFYVPTSGQKRKLLTLQGGNKMKYENRRNGSIGTIVEENEKSKTVILKLEDGKTVSISTSTLKRWWKKLPEEEVYTEAVQELAQECPEISQEELEKINEASEMFAGDGTPLEEVGKEIAEQAKQKSKKARKKRDVLPMEERYGLVADACKELGVGVTVKESQSRRVYLLNAKGKRAFRVYLGDSKFTLLIPKNFVPEGYTADRVRDTTKLKLTHAFDMSYSDMDKFKEFLSKVISKEEN